MFKKRKELKQKSESVFKELQAYQLLLKSRMSDCISVVLICAFLFGFLASGKSTRKFTYNLFQFL